MYLTSAHLKRLPNVDRTLGAGQVVVLPTLAPGTVVEQVIRTPMASARSTQQVDITASQDKIIDRVPWPHPFFRNFMTAPMSQVGPFYQGYMFSDPVLVSMGYFKNPGNQTDIDMAQYLYDNQDAVNTHFQASVQKLIDDEKAKAAREKAAQKKRAIATAVTEAVVGLFTAGIGTAILVVAEAAYSVYSVRRLTAGQLKDVADFYKAMNISPAAMDDFRVWITKLVSSPPEVPPTPTGITITSRYSFFNDGNYATQNDSAEAGLSRMMSLSQVGDRITVKDEASQSVYRVYLRVANGLRGVPPEDEHLLQTLTDSQAKNMALGMALDDVANTSGQGFNPALLLAIPAAWLVLR